jgi:trigger factor
MAITTEVVSLEENRVRLDVAVPQDEVDKKMNRTLRRLAKEVRIPGFRPGKAPSTVVMQRFGRDAVVDQMLRDSIAEWYAEAVSTTGVKPIDDPDVDLGDLAEESGVTFTATVHTRPKATLGAYTGLEVPKGEPVVPDEMIDDEITRLQERAATLTPVDRTAETGDFVTIDFDGEIDGEALASATARDYLVELGGQRIVGNFSDRLVGMSAGETKTFPIDYPDTDGRDELAGKTVHYSVTMKGVQAKVLPEPDDAFAQTISEHDTIAALRADITERLQQSAEDEVDELYRRAAIDAVVVNATVDVPDVMIAQRVDSILHETAHRLPQGMSFGDYLRAIGQTLDQARAGLRPDAEMAIKRELVVEAIVAAENIVVSDEEIEAQVRSDAEEGGHDPEKLLDELRKYNGYEQLREDMAMRMAVDLIVEKNIPIEVGLAEAREQIWTPEKDAPAPDAAAGLWTPDQPKPKPGAAK